MMAEEVPVVFVDRHAHQVEPDRVITEFEMLGEEGRYQSLEEVAIHNYLEETLDAVPTELAVDEGQIVLLHSL